MTYWSDDKLTLDDTPHILDTTLVPMQVADSTAEMLDTSLIPTQVIACGGKSQLMVEPFTSTELRRSFAQADLISNAEIGANNMVVELSVEVDPTTDTAERSFALTRPSVAQNVADLTAEVDFEVGPDVTSKSNAVVDMLQFHDLL